MASPSVFANAPPAPDLTSSATTSPSIALSPTSGTPGTPVTVRGTGFPSKARVDVYIDVPAQNLYLFASTETNGLFAFVATVNASVGSHRICANTYATSGSPKVVACAKYSVTGFQPKITVTPAAGKPGTQIMLIGSGFPRDEIVALYFDSPNPFLSTPGPRADSLGGFRFGSPVPSDAGGRGDHLICGETGPPWAGDEPFVVKVCVAFRVLGDATPSPVVTPSPAPSPPSSPRPTADATPTVANRTAMSFPWPVASGIAALFALGVGYYLGRRRP